MNFKKYLFSVFMIAVITSSAIAGVGKEAVLTAKSETGKVQLNVKIWDVEGPVSTAQLVTELGTFDLMADYDSYTVVDLPNHILTLCFQQKGKPAGDAQSLKVWAIPSSFVKMAASDEYNWRFKIKVGGNMLKEITTLSGTFEWNP